MTRRVCLLHTGGTIGMQWTADGYVPVPGFLRRYLTTMVELSQDDLPAWELHDLDPLLDSADMKPRDWVRIAEAVVERYDDFDGFVVLHGTDTMAYSASAVSFLLHGIAKPVVFTGAQLPLEDVRSDGRAHIITSMLIAAEYDIPEVCIYFGARLLRGNRSQKLHNSDFVAFQSGNLPPLATAGVRIEVNRYLVRRAGPKRPGSVELQREPEVLALRVFPGMSAWMLKRMLGKRVEGMVLETYGTGTFPSSDVELLDVIRDAIDRGVVVVVVSQCHSGRVIPSLYGTGAALQKAGVVSGHDMTPEAALTKLYCLLATGLSADDVKRRMEEDLAGEISPSQR